MQLSREAKYTARGMHFRSAIALDPLPIKLEALARALGDHDTLGHPSVSGGQQATTRVRINCRTPTRRHNGIHALPRMRHAHVMYVRVAGALYARSHFVSAIPLWCRFHLRRCFWIQTGRADRYPRSRGRGVGAPLNALTFQESRGFPLGKAVWYNNEL